jgi:hypothetical protein
MQRLAVPVCVFVALIGLSTAGFAQWLRYPTANLPRKSDGKPDLTAAAPRLPDGRPDFSGLWHAGNRNPCTPGTGEFIDCASEIGASQLASNLGRNLPGGLPYQPWAAEIAKQRTADLRRDDPHVRCLPDNPPRAWLFPHLTKAVHTPKLLVLLYEMNAMYRQIFIDGRPLPTDPTPGWNGYSTAHWEGDTLVVQTEGFRDDLWIDLSGSPMTDAAKMTERMRRPNYGTLQIELTVDDPKAYTRPWTVNLVQEIEIDTELIDEFCIENEKSYQRMQTTRGK